MENKDGHYILIKGLITRGKRFENIYVLNVRIPKYGKQILTDLNRKMNNNTIIVGNFYIPLTSMNVSIIKTENK